MILNNTIDLFLSWTRYFDKKRFEYNPSMGLISFVVLPIFLFFTFIIDIIELPKKLWKALKKDYWFISLKKDFKELFKSNKHIRLKKYYKN
jgi:hypothetical protein